MAVRFGGSLSKICWTVGPYDLVGPLEIADDASMTAVALALGALGNLRTTTMRAFDASERDGIIARAGNRSAAKYRDRRGPPAAQRTPA